MHASDADAGDPRPAAEAGPTGQAATAVLYLYAVVRGDAEGLPDEAYPLCGIDGAPVGRVVSDGVALVASVLTRGSVRPERRHLAANQAVLKALLQRGDVLPMAFGTLAADREAALRLIDRHRQNFTALLARVAGKVEMGVRVVLDAEDPVRKVVEREPALMALRSRYFRAGRKPNQDEMIEMGQMFETALSRYRSEIVGTVAEALWRHGIEVKSLPARNERDMANLACLTPRGLIGDFAGCVAEAAEGFGDEFAFDHSGPWAPHNFVDLHIEE